jgi:hypothetical protein
VVVQVVSSLECASIFLSSEFHVVSWNMGGDLFILLFQEQNWGTYLFCCFRNKIGGFKSMMHPHVRQVVMTNYVAADIRIVGIQILRERN